MYIEQTTYIYIYLGFMNMTNKGGQNYYLGNINQQESKKGNEKTKMKEDVAKVVKQKFGG